MRKNGILYGTTYFFHKMEPELRERMAISEDTILFYNTEGKMEL
jgi:hypothetical protein